MWVQAYPREAAGLSKKEDIGPDKMIISEKNSFDETLQVYIHLKFLMYLDILRSIVYLLHLCSAV